MACADTGEALSETVYLLHGNLISSYLWRHNIPHVSSKAGNVAPYSIGMERSGKPSITYRFTDHARYIGAFLEIVVPNGNVVLVIQDWGTDLGLGWARRHQDRVSRLPLMELVTPGIRWETLPERNRVRHSLPPYLQGVWG